MFNTTTITTARFLWEMGITGQGVDVALIDSGVTPVTGMTGRVVNGPDFSADANLPNLRNLDTYGHGTHMAGIIAGKESQASPWKAAKDTGFLGMAPGARVVNLKVAASDGSADMLSVVQAIAWAVAHKSDPGMNIRVLNLSFGIENSDSYTTDPVALAAEAAWRSGIVVVAAAGNGGLSQVPGNVRLTDPASNPWVIAVGADDPKGTNRIDDDVIPSWSSKGDGIRNPDVVAPGKSIQGLRVPGSVVDQLSPGGQINERYFRGSGTSQAAAVTSGAVALLLQQRPTLNPDAMKGVLKASAAKLPAADATAQGNGLINVQKAMYQASSSAQQTWPQANVNLASVPLLTPDPTRVPAANPWSLAVWTGVSWSGVSWSGVSWSGVSWSGVSWSSSGWTSADWK
jgi:serine protease AprX